MTSSEEKASAQLVAALVSPFVFYMSSRIDAADRRATLVAGGGVAFVAYLLDSAQRLSGPWLGTAFFGAALIAAAASVLLASFALFPRFSSADDWPSKIFLGRESSENILHSIFSSETAALSGMIESQMILGRILRKKNRFTYDAGIALMISFGLFLPTFFTFN